MSKQRGFTQLVIVLVVLLAIAAGVYLVQQETHFIPLAVSPKPTVPPVENLTRKVRTLTPTPTVLPTFEDKTDLESGLKELDNSDIDSIGNNLSQNDQDAATF